MSKNYLHESEGWLKPGVDSQFLVWLILLGIPAFLLFLIYSKEIDQSNLKPTTPVGIHYNQNH